METYFQNMAAAEGSKEKLIRDLNILLHDVEELIRVAGHSLSEHSRLQLQAALERFKATCASLEREAACAARAAEKLIQENPYSSVGLAFGLGLLLGVLIGRK
jgi:ElaB/YqjD/DUF883 family membrane-anchored ribosome-binding protein